MGQVPWGPFRWHFFFLSCGGALFRQLQDPVAFSICVRAHGGASYPCMLRVVILSHPSPVSWNPAQPPVPPLDRSQSLSGMAVLAQQTPGLPPLAISPRHTGLCLSTAHVLQMRYTCWTVMPAVTPGGVGSLAEPIPPFPDAIISLFSHGHSGMLDSLMPAATRHSCQLCGHRGCGELVVMPPQWNGNCTQHAGVYQRQSLHP